MEVDATIRHERANFDLCTVNDVDLRPRPPALLEAMLSRASPVAFGPAAGETRVLLPCVDDVASRAKNLSEAVLDPVSFAIRARQRTRRLHGLSSQYTVPAPTAREVREPANLVEIAVALRDSGLT